MASELVYVIPTAFDLPALATVLGALSCRLWTLPSPARIAPETLSSRALLVPLWRLLGVSMAVLALSSVGELIGRAVDMSGRPLSAILPVLPTVLCRTHYGRVWLIRSAALAALGIGWWVGRGRPHSRGVPAVMLGAGALIAVSRSASGHAADWGDWTLAELMDWLHLLGGSVWGGGLLALAIAVLPAAVKWPAQRRELIADIARRFSALAAVALALVLLSGFYSAWLQVGTWEGLWATPYGRALLAKLLLVIPLLALGASNHYLTVPLLQRCAGRPVRQRRLLHALRVVRHLITGRRTPLGARLIHQWTRKVGAEALLVAGILACTAFLLHGVPARHVAHIKHARAEAEAPTGPTRIPMQALHTHGGVPPGWRLRLPAGDPVHGRQVFGAMGCHACHTVRGEAVETGDAKLGPDLTGLGAHHPEVYLLESILNPNAVIVEGPGYTGADGRSIMPDYRDRLTVGQLLDLVAYLNTLREDQH